MKTAIRVVVFTLAGIFALFSLMLLPSRSQVRKNQMLLADMRDVVLAIKAFQRDSGRLPTDNELSRIEDQVPRRYSLKYNFRFGVPPSQRGESYPSEVKDGGWMIWYWRGEWSEFYSSWDDHYSLEEQTDFWRFCGPLIWAPPAAVAFFCLGFIPSLRRKAEQGARANAGTCHESC